MTVYGRLLVAASNRLARLCQWLAELLTEAERHLNRCPDCGRSRWYGRACK